MFSQVMIRENNFKYFKMGYNGEFNERELYNLNDDPQEIVNLVNDKNQLKLIAKLDEKLTSFWITEKKYLNDYY